MVGKKYGTSDMVDFAKRGNPVNAYDWVLTYRRHHGTSAESEVFPGDGAPKRLSAPSFANIGGAAA